MFSLKKIARYLKAKRMVQKNATVSAKFLFDSGSRFFSENKSDIQIGDFSEVLGTLVSKKGAKISIGNHTTIRFGSTIFCLKSISIGDNCMISNNVHIVDNNNHPISPQKRKEMTDKGFYGPDWDWVHSSSAPIVIENNVWIGEKSTILKGVTIGEGSIIGCNSVVTHDVPPYSIAAGNPAVVVKKID